MVVPSVFPDGAKADNGSNLSAQILKVCIKSLATFLPSNYQTSPFSQNNANAINWIWLIQFNSYSVAYLDFYTYSI